MIAARLSYKGKRAIAEAAAVAALASNTMIRRTLLALFPAVLAALTFLSGTPGDSGGKAHADAASLRAGVERIGAAVAPVVSVAPNNIGEDRPDGGPCERVNQGDDSDDCIIRVAVAIVRPQPVFEARALDAGDRVGLSHERRTAHPRAPPTA